MAPWMISLLSESASRVVAAVTPTRVAVRCWRDCVAPTQILDVPAQRGAHARRRDRRGGVASGEATARRVAVGIPIGAYKIWQNAVTRIRSTMSHAMSIVYDTTPFSLSNSGERGAASRSTQ